MSDYEQAIAKHNDAIAEFHFIRDLFREGKCDADHFLKAKAKFDKATAEFDKAYEIESNKVN